MKGNDIAACLVIALGVGGVLAGSLLGVGNQEPGPARCGTAAGGGC